VLVNQLAGAANVWPNSTGAPPLIAYAAVTAT
jgi:hypothetical protein